MQLRSHVITDPLFDRTIMLLVGGTPADVRAFLEMRHGRDYSLANKDNECDDDKDDYNDGAEFHINGPDNLETYYVWVKDPTPGLLHHEVFHLAHDVLHVAGVTFTDESEEAFAYWSEHVYAQMFALLFDVTPAAVQ